MSNFIISNFISYISCDINHILITTIIGGTPEPLRGIWDNISSQSIIPVTTNLSIDNMTQEGSAAWYNGSANVKYSPYFPILDFYNRTDISPTLQLLPHFKTYQQSAKYSCGNAAAFMALRYLNVTGITEFDLFKAANTSTTNGTNTIPLAEAIKKLAGDKVDVEYKVGNTEIPFTSYVEMVKECTLVENKCVLLLESVERGGHWMVVIGYDGMGTEPDIFGDDVLIFADPFDNTDHNQDGYYVTSLDRFYAIWFDDHLLDKDQNMHQYVKITAK